MLTTCYPCHIVLADRRDAETNAAIHYLRKPCSLGIDAGRRYRSGGPGPLWIKLDLPFLIALF